LAGSFPRLEHAIAVRHGRDKDQISGSNGENCCLIGESGRVDEGDVVVFGLRDRVRDDLVVIDAGCDGEGRGLGNLVPGSEGLVGIGVYDGDPVSHGGQIDGEGGAEGGFSATAFPAADGYDATGQGSYLRLWGLVAI
jgi:hypothetical protein